VHLRGTGSYSRRRWFLQSTAYRPIVRHAGPAAIRRPAM